MARKETVKLTIALSSENIKRLEEGKFNKNKLINSILEEYLLKNKIILKELL